MTYKYLLHLLLLIPPEKNGKSKTTMKHSVLHTGRCEQRKVFKHFRPLSYYYSEKKKNHKIYSFILLDFIGQYSLSKIWRPKKCKGADWCAGTALPQDKLKRLAAPAVCSAPGVQMSKLLVNQLPNHCSLQGRLCIAAITGVGLP